MSNIFIYLFNLRLSTASAVREWKAKVRQQVNLNIFSPLFYKMYIKNAVADLHTNSIKTREGIQWAKAVVGNEN